MSEPVACERASGSPVMDAPQSRIRLKQGGMLKVQGGHGVFIEAIEGRLWIIQESDVPDFELDAGESLQIGNSGVALIQALKSATLSLVPVRNRIHPGPSPVVCLVGNG